MFLKNALLVRAFLLDGTSGSVIYFVVEVIVGEKVVIPRLLGDVLNEVFFVGPVGNVFYIVVDALI